MCYYLDVQNQLNNLYWPMLIIVCLCVVGTLIDGEPIINLPPKTTHLTRVEFSTEERAFYNRLEAQSRSQFKVSSTHPSIHFFI